MKKLLARRVLLLILALTEILFGFSVYRLNMLPIWLMAILGVVLAILWIFIYVQLKNARRRYKKYHKGGKYVVYKLGCLFLSVCMIYGSIMMIRGNSFLTNIYTSGTKKIVYNVYAMADSSVKDIDDLASASVAYCNDLDADQLTQAVNDIDNQIATDMTLKEYDDYKSSGNAIFDGDVSAVICNSAYQADIFDSHKYCVDNEEVKVIYSYTISQKVKVTTKTTKVTSKTFTMYLTGIDTYGDITTTARSDVNLLATVNPKTKQILLLSIPRDSVITRPSNGEPDKLTHTGAHGINETIGAVEDLLDIDINYYAKINFTGLIDLVDAIGGVSVYSPNDFDCVIKVNKKVYHVNKGVNKFNGKQALSFVRERKHLPNGDFGRGQNQQRLLKAILKKCMSYKVLTNYGDILSAIEKSSETDLKSDEIKSLVNMQLSDMASWDINSVQIDGTPSVRYDMSSMPNQKCSVVELNTEKVQAASDVIQKMVSGEEVTDDDIASIKVNDDN